MAFIARKLTSHEEKENIEKIFNQLDKDHSGTLSKEELLEGYKMHINELDAEREVEEILAKVDIDESGKVDYSEFITAAMDAKKLLSISNV